ncbi:hypothetical protein LMG23992_01560 [Cupriavidus laharis]|uniref:DUF3455 domain-containing protein n=1 Tax=Cupriavidus laharis TaxID=151654 RepID=A0ABM8WSC3_9BURK|nr:DUF3455 domain-containing protein [Cupriavidus laharis]CAG9170360.1 hypothetical protein LMG23992_01560 [Cupriavidus laharis]
MSVNARAASPSGSILLVVAGLLASCATGRDAAPPELQPADAGRVIATLRATGVQVYQCKRDQGNRLVWTFRAPEANLYDAYGQPAGKHYAGPTWEAADGSKVTGKVLRQAANPREADSIPLLLLQATSAGGPGLLSGVRYIQRLNTQGGLALPQACNQEGLENRMPYRADYVFLQ